MSDPRSSGNKVSSSADDQRSGNSSADTPPWYIATPATIPPETQKFYTTYSGLSADGIKPHVTSIHDRGWKVWPFPCIGGFWFLQHNAYRGSWAYPRILERLRGSDDATFLDLGTCFGTALRVLAEDDAPSTRLFGVDIHRGLWDLGYELYRDHDKFRGGFFQADLLAAQPKADGDSGRLMRELGGRCDAISAYMFFHLFDWKRQRTAIEQTMLLTHVGGLVIGRHVGHEKAHPVGNIVDDKERYMHNRESWAAIWKEAAEATGTEWEVETRLTAVKDMPEDSHGELAWMEAGSILEFVAERKR